MSNQLDLFTHVACAYAETLSGRLNNADLYSRVAQRAGLAERELNAVVPIGASGQQHSPLKRKIRWFQQDLRRMGVLERVGGARGVWALTEDAGKRLHKIRSGVKLLAFSTTLGVAILGSCDEVFGDSCIPITLCVTSPPYLLAKPRDYGNPGTEREYIDFICKSLEPIVRNLVPGGSICLNISILSTNNECQLFGPLASATLCGTMYLH